MVLAEMSRKRRSHLIQRQKEYVRQLLTEASMGEIDPYLQRKTELTLPNIAIAIRRIDEGRGDLCIDCEEPIGEARLRAVAGAIRCVTCQENEERRER